MKTCDAFDSDDRFSQKAPEDPAALIYSRDQFPALRCGECSGEGVTLKNASYSKQELPCEACAAVGWFGINPRAATFLQPGTSDKVAVLAARYRAIEQAMPRNGCGFFASSPMDISPNHPGDFKDEECAYPGGE